MQTEPTPRQRTRRSDRYRQDAPVAEAFEPTAPDAAPAPILSEPVQHRRRSSKLPPVSAPTPPQGAASAPYRRAAAAPASIERRPVSEEAPRRADLPPMPRWLTISLVVLFFACLSMITAQSLMSAYLVKQEQARIDAHQALLNAHPLSYRSYIEQYAAEYNLQPAFVSSIILNESSYRPNAESGVGARGLMQLMPDTAEWIAHKLGISGYSFNQLWDAETNIRFGCWYLNYLSDLFDGDPVAVTAAYHAGQGQVSRWLSDRTISPDGATIQVANMIDGPTKVYAGRVTKAYAIYDALYYHSFNAAPDAIDAAAAP